METLREPRNITHKNLQQKLQADPSAYVESVGKQDKRQNAAIASHETGQGTVLRVFFWRY